MNRVSGQASVYDELMATGGLAEAHKLIIEAVPAGSRVLDVGCASGYLAEFLHREKGCEVLGLEGNPASVARAQERGIDVRLVDLEAETLSGEGFDVVVFADVLEHLRDSVAVLRSVRDASIVLASVPNIAHWTARRQVLFGRWPRDDHGLFDKTHLRYFNRDRVLELAAEAGYRVVSEAVTEWLLPFERRLHLPNAWRRRAADRWPCLFGFQFVMTLRPIP